MEWLLAEWVHSFDPQNACGGSRCFTLSWLYVDALTINDNDLTSTDVKWLPVLQRSIIRYFTRFCEHTRDIKH